MTIALVRPDDWNFPLLLHVAGAMLLVGALVTVAALLLFAWRGDSPRLVRLGFRTLLIAAIPSYVLMRVGAEWIASEEAVGDEAWVGIGYGVSEAGLLLILVATGIAWRTSRRAAGSPGRAVAVIAGVLLVAYLVAIWAMTAKPA